MAAANHQEPMPMKGAIVANGAGLVVSFEHVRDDTAKPGALRLIDVRCRADRQGKRTVVASLKSSAHL